MSRIEYAVWLIRRHENGIPVASLMLDWARAVVMYPPKATGFRYVCPRCGGFFTGPKSGRQYCSRSCAAMTGATSRQALAWRRKNLEVRT